MADPTPHIGLPEYEYIEILNTTTSPVNTKNFILTAGKHNCILPDFWLNAGEYAVICDEEAYDSLKRYCRIIPVPVFPPLLNSGQVVTLSSPRGSIIHSVSYTMDWYRNSGKSEGGFSLEIIDPVNYCIGAENWIASSDPGGGTPGQKNSVDAVNADLKTPALLRATLPSDTSVMLHFSEQLFPCTLSDPGFYSANYDLMHPQTAVCLPPDFSKVILSYPGGLAHNRIYEVSVLNSLNDCAGNELDKSSFAEFGISERPRESDIIFNEVLFDPLKDDIQFIELFNRSEHVFELAETSISLADFTSGDSKKIVSLKDHPFQLLPGRFVAITTAMNQLINKHPETRMKNLLEIPDFFVLPVDEGTLVLTDSSSGIIDEFHYSRQMHEPLLTETDGVSLERTDPDLPSSEPATWTSASSRSGYATPGALNSTQNEDGQEWNLALSSEYLSPDLDGIDDVITVHIQTDHPGWSGSVCVYNIQGGLICILLTRSLLGTDEYLCWDGRNREGKIVEPGLYILYGEFIDSRGRSKNFKKVIPVIKK